MTHARRASRALAGPCVLELAPPLGRHDEELLRELGQSAEEIAAHRLRRG